MIRRFLFYDESRACVSNCKGFVCMGDICRPPHYHPCKLPPIVTVAPGLHSRRHVCIILSRVSVFFLFLFVISYLYVVVRRRRFYAALEYHYIQTSAVSYIAIVTGPERTAFKKKIPKSKFLNLFQMIFFFFNFAGWIQQIKKKDPWA